MSDVQAGLYYTDDHEWLRSEADGSITVGISDHAQASLGELVFVELPASGAHFAAGDACAVVESVKAASDVYCPLAGEVTAVNDALEDAPEQVNQSPYESGWLFRLQPDDAGALEKLMDADAYKATLAALED